MKITINNLKHVFRLFATVFLIIWLPFGIGAIMVKNKQPTIIEILNSVIVEKTDQDIDIPIWVSHIPKHCFVGISKPSPAIEESRNQAINSAFSQILQAMGAEYSIKYESMLTGNKSNSRYKLDKQLMYTAKWFLHSIQQNVVKTEFQKIQKGYICFILMHMLPAELERLRKVAIGPKISARVVDNTGPNLLIKLTETNGVSATLTGYQIQTTNKNHNAKLITLFAWKIPEFSNRTQEGIIDKNIYLNGNSKIFDLPYFNPDPSMKQYILGTEIQMKIILQGHDEIGRKISVAVQKPPIK